MTTLATLEYASIELARPSIPEELSKLNLRRPSKHTAALIKALESADVSAEELHSLLLDPATVQLPVEIQGFAWVIYGYTLNRAGRYAAALEAFERAIQLWPDDPEAHYNRGVALGQLGRQHEALEAFEHVYPLRRKLVDLEPTLYLGVAFVSLSSGLSALKRRSLPDLEAATDAFIKWRARARRDKQTAAFKQAVEDVKNGLPAEEKEAFEEFMLGVRLMSIRDPFKAWKALGKEISKDWPKGVSAVEAVREQRRW